MINNKIILTDSQREKAENDYNFLIHTVGKFIISKIKNKNIYLTKLNLPDEVIRDNIENAIYNIITINPDRVNSTDQAKLLKFSFKVRINNLDNYFNFYVAFMKVKDIILFESDSFFNSDLFINKFEAGNGNNLDFGITCKHISLRLRVNFDLDICSFGSMGNIDSRNDLNDYIYKGVNYFKVFFNIFPLLLCLKERYRSNLVVDAIMPREYGKKISVLNKYFNFSNKTKSFKNINSGNHLIYYYDTLINYIKWKE